jgi:hypothetical protein
VNDVLAGLRRLAARATAPVAAVRLPSRAEVGPADQPHGSTPVAEAAPSSPAGTGEASKKGGAASWATPVAGLDHEDVHGARVAGTVDTLLESDGGRDEQIGAPVRLGTIFYGEAVSTGQPDEPTLPAVKASDTGRATDAAKPVQAEMSLLAAPTAATTDTADRGAARFRETGELEPLPHSQARNGRLERSEPGVDSPTARGRDSATQHRVEQRPAAVHAAVAESVPDRRPAPMDPRLRSEDDASKHPSVPPSVQIGRIDVQVTSPETPPDPFSGCRTLEDGLTTHRGGGW